MKKSYSSPNIFFQPLAAGTALNGYTCTYVNDQAQAPTVCPIRPAKGESWMPTIFSDLNHCGTKPGNGQKICYNTNENAVFNS